MTQNATQQQPIITKWLPIQAVQTTEQPGHDNAPQTTGNTESAQPGSSPLTFTASVQSEDRAGDLIMATGWELDAFQRNPVVLWAHQHHSPPIGRSLRTWVEGESLMATVEFAPTPFAQEVRRLYAEGFMRGVSVGFRALDTEHRRSGPGRRGVLFKRHELLEISAAPVPLHPDALAIGRQAPPDLFGTSPEPTDSVALEMLAEIGRLWRDVATLCRRPGEPVA